MATSREKLEQVQYDVSMGLNKIAELFTNDMELTLVVRHPDRPECYWVFSQDDLDKVVDTIRRSQDAATILKGDRLA